MRRILKGFGRFGRDRRGNFATMLAIGIVPLLASVGVAVDGVRALEMKSRISNAADAAVLAALSAGSPGMIAALNMNGTGPIEAGKHDAENFFRANVVEGGLTQLTAVSASVYREQTSVNSTLEYSADIKTTFARIFGYDKVPISGTASATINIDAAIDFYLLLDNTPSMGLGATTDDIQKLVANTPDKCAFACHALNNADNYYNLAKDLGVAMRIDVVREATQNLMDRAKKVRTYSNQYRMAVYSFGAAATAMGLTEIAALSSNLDQVKTKAGVLDLMTIPHQNYNNDQQTDFDGTLGAIDGKIANPGSGLGGNEPRKVLFFVSDGVGDSYKPYGCTKKIHGAGRCQEPIDTKACAAIKARGIQIAVLYTSYLPLPTNGWYNSWIKPFQSEIGTKMQECASPGLYFEVKPSQGISEAMDALFLKAISVLRLTS